MCSDIETNCVNYKSVHIESIQQPWPGGFARVQQIGQAEFRMGGMGGRNVLHLDRWRVVKWFLSSTTLDPKPKSRNPTPESRNLKPKTWNPIPGTRNPAALLISKPETAAYGPTSIHKVPTLHPILNPLPTSYSESISWTNPTWSRVEGKFQVNHPQMPPLRGGISMGVD